MDHRPGAQRSFVRTSLLLSVALLFAAIAVPAASGSTEPALQVDTGIDRFASGQDAIDLLGGRINDVARLNNTTAADLRSLLLSDPTVNVSSWGALFFMDPGADHYHDHDHADDLDDAPAQLLFEPQATFTLNSRPGSPRTIYLDFDGHSLTNTAWNYYFVPNGFVLPPYSIDGNAAFSTQELANIQNIWARIAEDYAPFEVNVTTQDPGQSAIHRSGSGDNIYGTRLVMTTGVVDHFCDSCGGLAFLDAMAAFGTIFLEGIGNVDYHNALQPALCFTEALNLGNAKTVAECGSHEVGHNAGLWHDGVLPNPADSSSYYGGHDPWAPIMGIGYTQPVTQWSRGEYSGANNSQDDFAVMATQGLALRADDHGNNAGSATLLEANTPRPGVIASQTDADYFVFTPTSTGTATIAANPAAISPNLDILLTLYASNGTSVLATANPPVSRVSTDIASGLNASISHGVSAGQTYYVRVEGTGHGSGTSGYTKYGSIGQYTVNLTGVETEEREPQAGETAGAFNPATGEWHLFDQKGFVADSFYFGNPGDIPFMGDWDGDGVDTPGLYRQSTGFAYIRYTNTQGAGDLTFHFGEPGDIPIVGDWDGDGKDTLSVYRPSKGQVFIINSLPAEGGSPVADTDYYFGNPGDKPFAGDFDGDGKDTVGLHRESTGYVYFRNTHTQGVADHEFFFGDPGDRLIAGDWGIVNGIDTPAVFRPSVRTWYFRHTNTQGLADYQFVQGAGNWIPVAGNFGLDD